MAATIHTIPEEQVKLLDRAGSRMNGFERNVTYRTERALRSAREALRVLLYLWLWQHDELAHSYDDLDSLLSACSSKPRDAEIAALAGTVLAACASLEEAPPKHPYDYTQEELHAEIEREALPRRVLGEIKHRVDGALGERLLLRAGDWIRHGGFGVARITAIEGLTAELEPASPTLFDHPGRPLRVTLLYGEVEKLDPIAESEKEGKAEADTFFFESKEEPGAVQHFQGTHWIPFFAPDTLPERGPQMLENSQELLGCGDFYHSQQTGSIAWTPASLRACPTGAREAVFVYAGKADGGLSLAGAYPYYEHGTQVTLALNRARVWPNGVMAQLECSWGMASLDFFDANFARNRQLYRAGREYEFILVGLAYAAQRCDLSDMEVPEGPVRDALRQMRLLEGHPFEEDEPERLSLRGMATLVHHSAGDCDVYEFRGPIKTVEPITMLGVSAWCIETTVVRGIDDDTEFDLRIIVTERAWEEQKPPRQGEDIEGILWLQGRLWNIVKHSPKP